MKKINLLAVLLASMAISAHAAEGEYYKYSDLLSSEAARKLDPAVKLYWGAEPAPAFAEVARPDSYTRVSLSMSFLGGSSRHCVQAFEKTLTAMVDDARRRGYDAVTNIRVMHDGKPSDDPLGFTCKPGYKVTDVTLNGTFAMTPAAMQRAAEAEEQFAKQPARPAAAGATFVPLEPILVSAEASAILGADIKAYLGNKTPEYSQRYGPVEYSADVSTGDLQIEAACRQAALKVLTAMVQDAKKRNFDSIIRIRSFLDRQYADATQVECKLGRRGASVLLQASLASRK